MRGFDRDLIRGKHYGQRSCEPHLKGRTHGCTDQVCYAKILLANPEPSTHGTYRTCSPSSRTVAYAQNHTTNSSRAIPIRVTSRIQLSAMPASRDLRCVFRQPAGTTPQPRCKV